MLKAQIMYPRSPALRMRHRFPLGNRTWKKKSGARIYNLMDPNPKLKLDTFPFQVLSTHDPRSAGFFRLVPLAAENALNMCSVKVIRRFINRSWRWMSAYRMGLTGKATQRAVRKQKGLRCASRTAMMHLDAVLNGS